MSCKVSVPVFTGPFDLLVYLIENSRMSVYDIQISEITGQYLEHMKAVKPADPDMGAEFMVLAATLIEIKSKMMLPGPQGAGKEAVREDPRKGLVLRLLEYRRYKEAAEMLKKRGEMTEDIFEKPKEDISEFTENPDQLLDIGLKRFAAAFRLFLRGKQEEEEIRSECAETENDNETVENRILYIREKFRAAFLKGVHELSFGQLVPDRKSRFDIVVTFVSLLRMISDKYLDAFQSTLYGGITVTRGSRDMEEEDHVQ